MTVENHMTLTFTSLWRLQSRALQLNFDTIFVKR